MGHAKQHRLLTPNDIQQFGVGDGKSEFLIRVRIIGINGLQKDFSLNPTSLQKYRSDTES